MRVRAFPFYGTGMSSFSPSDAGPRPGTIRALLKLMPFVRPVLGRTIATFGSPEAVSGGGLCAGFQCGSGHCRCALALGHVPHGHPRIVL